jgi:hypothetical protein
MDLVLGRVDPTRLLDDFPGDLLVAADGLVRAEAANSLPSTATTPTDTSPASAQIPSTRPKRSPSADSCCAPSDVTAPPIARHGSGAASTPCAARRTRFQPAAWPVPLTESGCGRPLRNALQRHGASRRRRADHARSAGRRERSGRRAGADCEREHPSRGSSSFLTGAVSAWSSVAAQLASRFSASSDLEPGSAV